LTIRKELTITLSSFLTSISANKLISERYGNPRIMNLRIKKVGYWFACIRLLAILICCLPAALLAQDLLPPVVQETEAPTFQIPETPQAPVMRRTPRTPHDYGPPGYIRSRKDHGGATPIHEPVQFYVDPELTAMKGSFPGSIRVPGTKTSIKIGGFVRGVGIYDFNPIGSNDDFVTTAIPVPQTVGQNATFTARATRLVIESHTDSDCLGDVKTYFELDFFESTDQSDFASYRLRSRKLYFDVGWFRFGQDASVFTDYHSFPSIIDYEWPGSKLLTRNGMARMTIPVSDHFKIALSAEQPFTDMTIPTDINGNALGQNVQDLFDFAGHLRYDTIYGHLQLAGIVRRLGYRPNGAAVLRDTGYGVAFTGDVHPWGLLFDECPSCNCPTPRSKDRMVWEYSAGYGISRYFADPKSANIDAALNLNGELEAIFMRGWYVGYEHWWNNCWLSTFSYGENDNGGTDAIPGTTYGGSDYAAVNLKWAPTKKFWIGVEYLWGERHNLNTQSARARRISMGAQYNF